MRGAGELPGTLGELLARTAELRPERGIGLLDGRGRLAERRTWPEVLAAALEAGARLRARGLAPGEPLLLSLPTSFDLIDHWLGAVLAGVHPVAIAPIGGMGTGDSQLARAEDVRERLGARLVLAPASFRAEAHASGRGALAERTLTPEDLRALPPERAFAARRAAPEDVAFLQLTSGSTGRSRAAVISHAAAVHNPWASSLAIGAPWGAPAHEWADAMVSWLPLHHDMGLVGGLLFSILCGLDLWLLAPKTFLARPELWLSELGRRGATIAAAPNFAYQACVERALPSALEGADLSRWRGALVGAEMVRVPTMRDFAALFAPKGFEERQLRPCYGLAEGTLAVTFDVAGEGVRTRPMPAEADPGLGVQEVVGVGAAIADTRVEVRGPDGRALPEGRVGEVCAAGPGIFAGYWRDAEATAEGLREGWLHTGDLGFLHAGELYLTGRTKDLLILRGQNVMPHEIEWCVEEVTGGGGSIRSGAFSVASGVEGEQPVVVTELADPDPARLAELERAVRLRVARALGFPLADVLFVRRGRIPKTTSGKVQRRELRRRYLAGELERLVPSEPGEPAGSSGPRDQGGGGSGR